MSRRAPITGSTRVLDFGGGYGRLNRELAARGADCHLVDYNEKAAPWVRHFGATERDLVPGERFHLILCNHVIEDVADPVAVLSALSRHLSPGGTIYVEVPMEIWRRAPLHEEPVTHVNFFTPLSLARCLHEAGIGVSSYRLRGYLHPSGRTPLAVAAFGRPGRGSFPHQARLQPWPRCRVSYDRGLGRRSGAMPRRRWLSPRRWRTRRRGFCAGADLCSASAATLRISYSATACLWEARSARRSFGEHVLAKQSRR